MTAKVNLDHDVYTLASTYATARGISLGAAINDLLRRAEQAPAPPPPTLIRSKCGLLVKAKSGRTVTPAMVKQFSEDDFA